MKSARLFLSIALLAAPLTGEAQRRNSEDEMRDNRRRMEERILSEASRPRSANITEQAARKKAAEEAEGKYSLLMPRPSREDQALIAVDEADRKKFDSILKQKKAGIFKLFDALDCDEENYLLDARHNCPNGFIGKAASYSFRVRKYREKSFADIFLENENLSVRGFNVLGIMTELGEVPLESLTLSAPGVRELFEMKPSERAADLKQHVKLIRQGVQVGDHVFRSSVRLKPGRTYLLRSIAYKSKSMPDIKKTFFTYESWSEDKRDDVLVAFRCVRKNEDNSWILVWKELDRRDAPDLSKNK